MKLLPILLLNVATVAVALVVYEQLRSEPASVVVEGGGDEAALLRRIEALESARSPALVTASSDAQVLDRLNALEETMGVTTTEVVQATKPSPDEDEPAAKEKPTPTASFEPTPAAIARFRQLQNAVRQQDRMKKNAPRVNRALDKLALNLDEKQRARIHAAHTAFESRVGQIWTEVKSQASETQAAGGQVNRGEIVSSTMARIQQEFAQTLDGVVSQPDAEAIAGALHPSKR